MNVRFIPAYAHTISQLTSEQITTLPASVAVVGTIQFIKTVDTIVEQLRSAGKDAIFLKGKHSKERGQVLGCDLLEEPMLASVDSNRAILFVGDGLFHPKAFLLSEPHRTVYAFRPSSQKMELLDKGLVTKLKQKERAQITRFLMSTHIGVIESLKWGQQAHRGLKKIYETYPDKHYYTFLTDTIDFSDLENFSYIDCWINTACPRISYDDTIRTPKPLINYALLLDMIEDMD